MRNMNNCGTGSALASPWHNPPAYDPFAEFIERTRQDADRLDAVSEDDRRWFEAHPERNFHLRAVTPHERGTGYADDMILVAQVGPGLRWRIPVKCYFLANATPATREAFLASIPEHDTEKRAAEWFDQLTAHFTSCNTHADLYKIVQELRRKRAKVSRRKR
jgi:hypothetical protein